MPVSKSLRYQILRRDNHTCRYCGRSAPEVRITVDHVVPEALGGPDTPENLVAACSDCNSGKSATPPDAAQVEQVRDDALRWSAAVRAVAADMVAGLERRRHVQDQFQQGWQSWNVDGQALPLPSNWRDTVDTFAAIGLPMAVLLDCVQLAMTRNKIDDRFRYMCGIAWNRVSELQQAALARAGQPAPRGSMRQGNGDEVVNLLFGALPWCDRSEEWPTLIEEFDEAWQDEELEDGTPRTFDHWSDVEKVFAQSVTRVEDMRIQLVMWARDTIKALPPAAVDDLRERVTRRHSELGEPFGAYCMSDYLAAFAVTVAARQAYPDAKGPVL